MQLIDASSFIATMLVYFEPVRARTHYRGVVRIIVKSTASIRRYVVGVTNGCGHFYRPINDQA